MNDEQKQSINAIVDQYTEKKRTKFDELKSLDRKVKLPANVFAYIFGTLGALVLGVGMCFAMKVIGDIMALGIVVGCVGIAMVSINYPIYSAILKSRKKKYSQSVIELSESILNN
ncbi:MAG: dihydropteridine reductase [Clostridia bacterium]|nr:dihydropteridine reductase [Clostridia bacterium]MDE7329069.1 dihydropteridine reductase [Clostridia bacterium]